MRSKQMFYHKGVDNQNKCDLSFEVFRENPKKIAEWPNGISDDVLSFISRCDKVYNAWKHEVLASIGLEVQGSVATDDDSNSKVD